MKCKECLNVVNGKCPFVSRDPEAKAPHICFHLNPPPLKVRVTAHTAEGVEVANELYDHAVKADRNAIRLFVWYWLSKNCTVTSTPQV